MDNKLMEQYRAGIISEAQMNEAQSLGEAEDTYSIAGTVKDSLDKLKNKENGAPLFVKSGSSYKNIPLKKVKVGDTVYFQVGHHKDMVIIIKVNVVDSVTDQDIKNQKKVGYPWY